MGRCERKKATWKEKRVVKVEEKGTISGKFTNHMHKVRTWQTRKQRKSKN